MDIDYSRKWLVMIAVGMGIFLATIDSSIVNIALPTLEEAFSTNFPTVQWVVLAYLLGVTTLMLTIGRLGDMHGKKPIYTTGFIVFTTGSVLCGLSPSIYALIGFRLVQAIGAAMVMALGTAIITEAFPPSERGKALGITGTIVSVGIVIGPIIGGMILGIASWHWIFFVNLPIGILGTWIVIRNVPAIRPPGGQQFDFGGALSLFALLTSLLLALTIGQDRGFSNAIVLGLMFSFVFFLLLFIYVERNHRQPMIDLSLFRNKLLSINLVTGFVTFVCIAGATLLMPFYLQIVLGYTPAEVGRLLATVPILMAFASPVSGIQSDRFGTRRIAVIGLLVLAIGYLLLSYLKTDTPWYVFIIYFMPIGIGMGIFQSPNNSAIMGSAPKERLGIVSGMLAVNRTLGQTTGIAILSTIWTGFVFSELGTTLPEGATAAPAQAQVTGLHYTFLVMVGLVLFALGLSIWAVIEERKTSISNHEQIKT